ncbi:MAG: hypothetical protein QOI15_1562 [Pseudonocardiales bacterium]|jgi:uncharacterized protein (DUF1810 family)|nr:hypothetical protein [Pseudonocardiales bacterium]MDT4920660.1 hypothetical protein [Pseudonocardiales bacterium]
MTDDRYDLIRFVSAQAKTYDYALAELRAGNKRSHWMWFVFPQLAGLGHSSMAQRYGITGLAEARAYLEHPVLGRRLREISAVVAALPPGARAIFGSPDDLKLRSSMTLFLRAAPAEPVFQQVLDRHYDGKPDAMTDQLLGR